MSENIDTNSWDNILHDDEKIHWQGSPVPGVSLRVNDYIMISFGLGFVGVATFISFISRHDWATALFPLPFFMFGIGIALNPFLWKPMILRRTYYTLTNKRAFIARHVPFLERELKAWPLDRIGKIELKASDPGSVFFAENVLDAEDIRHNEPIGFERIKNAREVFSMMSQLRQDLIEHTPAMKQDA